MSGIFGRRRSEGGSGADKPGPPAPPVPAIRNFGMTIGQTRGKRIAAWLIPDFHEPIEGQWSAPWRCVFAVPQAVTEGATIRIWPADYPGVVTDRRASFGGTAVDSLGGLPRGDAELDGMDVDWRGAIEPPGRWSIDGQFCRGEAGQPVLEKSASAFAAFERYVRDGAGWFQDYCGYHRELGFNTLRVFMGYWGGLGQFNPIASGAVPRLPEFWGAARDNGMRIHQTVFADTPNWLPSPVDQAALFGQIDQWAEQFLHVRLAGVNEGNDYRNRADGLLQISPAAMRARRGMRSHGSTTQDAGYLDPAWGTADYHPARAGDDWSRKPGHNAWEDVGAKLNLPAFASEIKRPDEAGYDAGRFYEAGAGIALMCAGGTFHSNEGKAAGILAANTRDCGVAFLAGMGDVPLDFRTGHYSAGHQSDSPVDWKEEWEGRAHAKILGTRACVVLGGMDRAIAAKVDATNGWAVTERRGPSGQVILLAR